jgi:nucleoid DNA-binding protein
MATITRADLSAAAYQAVSGPSRAQCDEIVRQTFDAISKALVAGEAVKITRFAVFTPKRKGPRLGRNPRRPAEEHVIPEHVALWFTASGELKGSIKRGPLAPKGVFTRGAAPTAANTSSGRGAGQG